MDDFNRTLDFLDVLSKECCFVDLDILEDRGIGYYKTIHIKYKDINGNDISYLFPITFQYINGNLVFTMILGSIEKDFIVPENVNGTYKDSKHFQGSVELKTSNVSYHSYKLLVIDGRTNIFDLKSYQCIIEGLNSIGFPFMRISNSIAINSYNEPNTFDESTW
ncbi:hypothetical protein [Sulfuricurvum sp.]|uniref:hypothetical protein n=1 Tax=Sulfuricurvum sp. TaxID=2025608 RepID=UPI0026095DA2|nr:hypothetical protein [Sulfuricurvum sp.]MDD2267362.1 hypothetical protein [Sulfuricurvum sp.]